MIALSEVAFSDLTRAFINILDSACYGVFQKQKNCQEGIEPQTESLTAQIWVKTQNLVKAVEIRRENGIIIPLEIPEKIFHPFFIPIHYEGTRSCRLKVEEMQYGQQI